MLSAAWIFVQLMGEKWCVCSSFKCEVECPVFLVRASLAFLFLSLSHPFFSLLSEALFKNVRVLTFVVWVIYLPTVWHQLLGDTLLELLVSWSTCMSLHLTSQKFVGLLYSWVISGFLAPVCLWSFSLLFSEEYPPVTFREDFVVCKFYAHKSV